MHITISNIPVKYCERRSRKGHGLLVVKGKSDPEDRTEKCEQPGYYSYISRPWRRRRCQEGPWGEEKSENHQIKSKDFYKDLEMYLGDK